MASLPAAAIAVSAAALILHAAAVVFHVRASAAVPHLTGRHRAGSRASGGAGAALGYLVLSLATAAGVRTAGVSLSSLCTFSAMQGLWLLNTACEVRARRSAAKKAAA